MSTFISTPASRRGPRWLALAVLAVAPPLPAQEAGENAPQPPLTQAGTGPLEEMVVIGRYRSAATDVVSERIDQDVPVDFLDAESISRVGDSDVAAALRRVPGVTLVNDQFVYVRGLGERYSSSLLNGASVPSPDLTRTVLPLDIFPAEIIDSLAVQKGYAPELPAAFGGGNINIRTKRVPEDRVLSFEISTGWNSEGNDDGFTYSGGDDDAWGTDDGTRALSGEIKQAIQHFQGSFAPSSIFQVLRYDGAFHTIEEAEAVNRQLATELNRDIDLREKSLDPDVEAELTGGYRWFIGDDLEVGVLGLASYENEWRNKERTTRRVQNPETDLAQTLRTVNAVNLTGSANLGLRYTEDHQIGTVSMYLRNTEDEASSTATCQLGQFNDCGDATPTRGRLYDVRFEERDLTLNQVFGEHTLGDATLERLPEFLNFAGSVRDTRFSWYHSDATAESDIPNEVRISAVESLDPATGLPTETRIRSLTTAAEYRFSDLEDEVVSHGWDLMMPFHGGNWDLELSTGYDYVKKGRSYTQTSLGLGSTDAAFVGVAGGLPSEVFSDANLLDPDLGYRLSLGVGGFGTESYFAGQLSDAYYGKFDALLNDTWRLSGGARWEDFRQLSVPVDLLEFDGPRIPMSPEEIAASAINEDEWYPSLALTYIRPGFLADEFQLRLAWSETVTRPELREIAESTYIDPLTEARVRGNPELRPSELTNYDIRGEWFWDNGDNFTVSLFYKDISRPIETVQGGATEDNILFNFVNAETAEVYGAEIEGLKGLGFAADRVGGWIEQLYVAGNLTLSDSEIDIPPGAGVGNITNETRPLTQQSEWVVNLQVGFDSFNARHGATLVYNAFGERVFFAGIQGFDDAYEQPFHSLDLVYSWFPTDQLTVKLRLRNLLNESIEIEQQGVTILEQEVGTTAMLDLKWQL